jgi:energy-coupling factor transporter ATP-binding protein EcfA2
MKITNLTVSGDGLKGLRFHTPLTGCDIVMGTNGSGKTTVLLALLGLLDGVASVATDTSKPWLGERPKAVVTATTDAGHILSRDLSLTSAAGSSKESQAAIEAALGKRLVRFDLADFERGADSAREAVLSSLLQAAGLAAWDAERMETFLEKALPLDYDQEGSYLHSLDSPPEGGDTAAWLSTAITKAASLFTEINRLARERTASAKQQAERMAAQEVPGGTLEQWEAEQEKLRAQLRSLEDEQTRGAATRKLHEEHLARGTRLLAACAAAMEECERANYALRTSIAELDAAKAVPEIDTRPSMDGTGYAMAALGLLENERVAAERQRVAAGEIRDAKHETFLALAAVTATLSAQQGEQCVDCGSSDPLGHAKKMVDAKAKSKAADEAYWAADAVLREAEGALNAVLKRKAEAEAAYDRCVLEEKRVVNAKSARALAIRDADAKVDQARTWLQRAEAAQVASDAALEAHNAETIPPRPADDAETSKLIAVLKAEWSLVETKHGEHVRFQRQQQLHAEAVMARESAETRLAEMKRLRAALDSLREAMTRDGFKHIEDAAAEILAPMGLVLRFKSASDFGAQVLEPWPRPCEYAHFAALSGAQRAIVGAAVAVAFATLSGVQWKGLVLDSLESITESHRNTLLAHIANLCMFGDVQLLGALAWEGDGEGPALPDGVATIDARTLGALR